ncbi:MAG: Lin0512 family protein [Thermococcus sp.]|uniref:Lin0512 family protein n=1 Tax=Thermococcus sp. TaxID=35749 RepID=UPI001D63355E|nr:Lin0512 family protein [Thermococcus sp.]MBO8174974.1 Lin0512 family protein [Thermococcus sp.]
MSEWKRYVIEIGMGIDQHGQDSTKAAIKAVKDAISRVCTVGLLELFELDFERDVKVEAIIGVPYPENVDVKEVRKAIPLKCEKIINVVNGGLKGPGIALEEFGDKTNEMLIAVAFITIYVRGERK